MLNKPSGPTSARCLSALKRLGQRKIGHAGTLAPMASGVLLVLLVLPALLILCDGIVCRTTRGMTHLIGKQEVVK